MTLNNIWTTQSKTAKQTIQRLYDQWCRKIPFPCNMMRHASTVSRVDFWPGSERWSLALPSQCLWSQSRPWKQRPHRKRLSRPNWLIISYSLPKNKGVHPWRLVWNTKNGNKNVARLYSQMETKILCSAVQCWLCSATRQALRPSTLPSVILLRTFLACLGTVLDHYQYITRQKLKLQSSKVSAKNGYPKMSGCLSFSKKLFQETAKTTVLQ